MSAGQGNENVIFSGACKIAFRPYDLAVAAFLLIAQHHLGSAMVTLACSAKGNSATGPGTASTQTESSYAYFWHHVENPEQVARPATCLLQEETCEERDLRRLRNVCGTRLDKVSIESRCDSLPPGALQCCELRIGKLKVYTTSSLHHRMLQSLPIGQALEGTALPCHLEQLLVRSEQQPSRQNLASIKEAHPPAGQPFEAHVDPGHRLLCPPDIQVGEPLFLPEGARNPAEDAVVELVRQVD